MNASSFGPLSGLAAGLPTALAGALSGAPWWAVGVITATACIAVPVTGMTLDHIRQRKGDLVAEKFAAALGEIQDPEKRVQAIIRYRQAATRPAPGTTSDPLGPEQEGNG